MPAIELNLQVMLPEFIVLGTALGAIITELLLPADRRALATSALSLVGLLVAFAVLLFGSIEGAALRFIDEAAVLRSGGGFAVGTQTVTAWISDGFSIFCRLVIVGGGALLVLLSMGYTRRLDRGHGEFYALLLFSLAAVMLVTGVQDLLSLFVCLETVTILAYVLAAFKRNELKSTEAGLKYLLVGAVSTALLLMGIAFVYGATGSLSFEAITAMVSNGSALAAGGWLMGVGLVLLLSGLLFKVGGVPFQVWIPDVYQGAPTPVTAFLSTASKAAGLILLMRLAQVAFVPGIGIEGALPWVAVLALVATVSILMGTLGAVPQRSIKRMLGYSSIGHAGYLLMGIAALAGSTDVTVRETAVTGILYYLVAYVITNLTGFTVITLVSKARGSHENEAYKGLAQTEPFVALAMLLVMLSLAGVPPMAGFFGKFLVLNAAVKGGLMWLAFVGALGVVISLYFYLSWVKDIYMGQPSPDFPATRLDVPASAKLVLWLGIIGMIGLGVFMGPLTEVAHDAAKVLTGIATGQ